GTARSGGDVGDPAGRSISVRGRRIPVTGPSWRDHRMHVAAVIFTLHVIGQIWLSFELSIAQIVICLAGGGVIELLVTLGRDHALVWLGSGLLTANGVAFV